MSAAAAAKLVILGTGGTIAGQAESTSDNVGYTAAQVSVAQLVAGVPALKDRAMVSEQIVQLDSKDMAFSAWQRLLERTMHHLGRDDVAGVVITHGTDTLEETAWFLHLTLEAAAMTAKPVVLTCAMRPASSRSPDGPQNLLDAVALASDPEARGVLAVCAGVVHTARDIQKIYSYRLDAFSSGDAGPVAMVEEGRVRWLKCPDMGGRLPDHFPAGVPPLSVVLGATKWPRVEIVMNHAGADGRMVDLLVAERQGLRQADTVAGIVVAGTGNGTVHTDLEAALTRAVASGVCVWRTSRCYQGAVIGSAGDALPALSGTESPVKARVRMILHLLVS